MIDTIRSQRCFAFFGTILLLFVCLASATTAAEESAPADDGWRRTINGWEHISTWNVSPTPRPVESDFQQSVIAASWSGSLLWHPLVVSAGLIVIAWGALTLPHTREIHSTVVLES